MAERAEFKPVLPIEVIIDADELVALRSQVLALEARLDHKDGFIENLIQLHKTDQARIEEIVQAVRAFIGDIHYVKPKEGEPHTGWDLQQALAFDAPTVLSDLHGKLRDAEADAKGWEQQCEDAWDATLRLGRERDAAVKALEQTEARLATALSLLTRTFMVIGKGELADNLAAFLADNAELVQRAQKAELVLGRVEAGLLESRQWGEKHGHDLTGLQSGRALNDAMIYFLQGLLADEPAAEKED